MRRSAAHEAGGGSSSRFLVYVYSQLQDRQHDLERALVERVQGCRRERRPRIVRIAAEQRPDLLRRLRIQATPALLVVDEGIVRARVECAEGPDAAAAIAGVLG